MENIRKNKVKYVVYVVIIVAVAFCGNWLYKDRRVHFEDNMMRQVICLKLGKDKDSKDITYRELETIEELDIGPVGEYETLIDIGKFRNLKKLRVNVEITSDDSYYELFQKNTDGRLYYPPVDEKKLIRVQEELKIVVKKLKKFESFVFSNVNESCNITDFTFLKESKNLKELTLCFVDASDYSFLENYTELKKVDLEQSNIEKADVLLNLKNVNRLILTGTPLAQNEEELVKLKKAFPEAEIVVD